MYHRMIKNATYEIVQLRVHAYLFIFYFYVCFSCFRVRVAVAGRAEPGQGASFGGPARAVLI